MSASQLTNLILYRQMLCSGLDRVRLGCMAESCSDTTSAFPMQLEKNRVSSSVCKKKT